MSTSPNGSTLHPLAIPHRHSTDYRIIPAHAPQRRNRAAGTDALQHRHQNSKAKLHPNVFLALASLGISRHDLEQALDIADRVIGHRQRSLPDCLPEISITQFGGMRVAHLQFPLDLDVEASAQANWELAMALAQADLLANGALHIGFAPHA